MFGRRVSNNSTFGAFLIAWIGQVGEKPELEPVITEAGEVERLQRLNTERRVLVVSKLKIYLRRHNNNKDEVNDKAFSTIKKQTTTTYSLYVAAVVVT